MRSISAAKVNISASSSPKALLKFKRVTSEP
jgi:hypothetical protein